MNICMGLTGIKNLEKFISSGVTEFYCGVVDDKWLNTYNYIVPLNRRPWPDANVKSFEELEEIVKIAHNNNCSIFYTVNDHSYSDEQIKILDYYMQKAINCKVDAFIFADIGIAKYFKKKYSNITVHISTGGISFNRYTIDFYVKELEASRIILPREVSIKEIELLTKDNSDIEFEVFVKNEGCTFIDGICNHIHGIKYDDSNGRKVLAPPCNLEHRLVNNYISTNYRIEDLNRRLNLITRSKRDCGLCAIFFFMNMNIKSLKLVGRDTNVEKLLDDIKMIKYAEEMVKITKDFEEYRNIIAKRFCKNIYKDESIIKCYYPEVLTR